MFWHMHTTSLIRDAQPPNYKFANSLLSLGVFYEIAKFSARQCLRLRYACTVFVYMYMYILYYCWFFILCRIYAISVKLSPEKSSSGINCLEGNSFKIYCFQTLTGTYTYTCTYTVYTCSLTSITFVCIHVYMYMYFFTPMTETFTLPLVPKVHVLYLLSLVHVIMNIPCPHTLRFLLFFFFFLLVPPFNFLVKILCMSVHVPVLIMYENDDKCCILNIFFSYSIHCTVNVGVKFIVVADSKQQKVEELLRKIYELYADYVLKNPFYSLDMPIRFLMLCLCV